MSLNGRRFGGNHTTPPTHRDNITIAFWGCAVPGFFTIGLFFILWSVFS